MSSNPRQPTARQQRIFEFIKGHIIKKGFPPTVREIAGHFGFASPLSAQVHIKALIKKGLLRKSPFKQRTLEILGLKPAEGTKIPLLGRVRAGLPVLASEDIEDYINVDKNLFKVKDGFALRIIGDSMIEAGIFEGDIAVVTSDVEPVNGDIVVALIGEEATIKRFFLKDGMIKLMPENKRLRPTVHRADDVRIIGRVVGILRSL